MKTKINTPIESAMLLALAAEQEAAYKVASNPVEVYRAKTPSAKVDAQLRYRFRNQYKQSAEALIDAAAAGVQTPEVQALVQRLLYDRLRYPRMLQEWIEKEVVPHWM